MTFATRAVVVVLALVAALGSCARTAPTTAGRGEHLDIEYVIAGVPIELENGSSSIEAAPGSATRVVTRYFGNEVRKDLDGDGTEDVAFLLTQDAGGSGTFFYVVAALASESGYRGSRGVLIGDRIAPQSTESGPGRSIIVNYADRAAGDAFSVPPSVGKSLRLLLDPETLQFGEVVSDFEGEADPAGMTLDMKAWRWIRTATADGADTVPREEGVFTLTFSRDGTFAATTDCNNMRGAYSTTDTSITFGEIASTRMFCEGSQEPEFASFLTRARAYRFTSRGELLLILESNGGPVVFR